MRILTIIEDNRITGITYGMVEVDDPIISEKEQKSVEKYRQAYTRKHNYVLRKRSR